MDLRVLRRFEERRIEDLFLDRRVRSQGETDLLRELALAVLGARALEIRRTALDLAMIGFQQTRSRRRGRCRSPRGLRELRLALCRCARVERSPPFFALRDLAMACLVVRLGRLSGPQLHVSCHDRTKSARQPRNGLRPAASRFGAGCNYCDSAARPARAHASRPRHSPAAARHRTCSYPGNHVVVESTWNCHRTDAAGHSSSKSVRPSTAAVRRSSASSAKPIDVEADVIVEGHERIACVLLHAPAAARAGPPCR